MRKLIMSIMAILLISVVSFGETVVIPKKTKSDRKYQTICFNGLKFIIYKIQPVVVKEIDKEIRVKHSKRLGLRDSQSTKTSIGITAKLIQIYSSKDGKVVPEKCKMPVEE